MKAQFTLGKDGFCIFSNTFSKKFAQQLIEHANALISHKTEVEKNKLLSLGSLINLWEDPFFSSLIAHPHIIHALQTVGAKDIRYAQGYLLIKPPRSLPTFWHQDWWLWNDPASYTSHIQQIGVLCYLQDMSKNNGTLRVLPGSHRKEHSLHGLLKNLDNDELRRGQYPDTEPYQSQIGEVNLELKLGDIVLIDARLLHGANANQSEQYRHGIALWYYPNYNLLSEAVKARIGTVSLAPDWSEKIGTMQHLLPLYKGGTVPEDIINHPHWKD